MRRRALAGVLRATGVRFGVLLLLAVVVAVAAAVVGVRGVVSMRTHWPLIRSGGSSVRSSKVGAPTSIDGE